MPKVSVCCSVLNQSEWLFEMIGSVYVQSLQDWELIIVDDGSTEDIPAVIARFKGDSRIRYHRFEQNRGIPHGGTWALQHALGEYVVPLAADELLEPGKFAHQAAFLDAHPEIQAVFGLPENGPLGERPEWEQYGLLAHNRSREQWLMTLLNLQGVPVGGAGSMVRRSVYEQIGYYDEKLVAFSDHEWYVRFFKRFKGWMLPYRCALSRPNPLAVSKRPDNAERSRAEFLYVRERHPLEDVPVNGKVTVCIPCKNMGWSVQAAIDSVRGQDYPNWELFVIDDGSTDDTAKKLSAGGDSRIHIVLFPENKGNHEAANYALARASGDYFMLLAADDTIEPTLIARCVQVLNADPVLEFCATQTDFIDKDGKPYAEDHPFKRIEKAANKTQQEWKERLYYGNVYFGTGVYRTQALRDVGGWVQFYKALGDYDMYLRMVHRANIYVIEEALTHTRIHEANQSSHIDVAWLKQTYAEIKRKYYPPTRKLIIATPFYESRGYAPYIMAMCHTIRMLTMAGIEHEFMEVSGDAYVDRVKNTIINRALEDEDMTDLLMIDSDMWWDPGVVLPILRLPEEIVVGSYPTKNAWEQFSSAPRTRTEPDGTSYTLGRTLPDGSQLLEGGAMAGGFVRFKRSALEKYREHYKDRWYKDPAADPRNPHRVYTEFYNLGERAGNLFWGEDRAFSRRLEAMGLRWWIYADIRFGHFGMNGWYGNFAEHLAKLNQQEQQREAA